MSCAEDSDGNFTSVGNQDLLLRHDCAVRPKPVVYGRLLLFAIDHIGRHLVGVIVIVLGSGRAEDVLLCLLEDVTRILIYHATTVTKRVVLQWVS